MKTVPNTDQDNTARDASWWKGYAQALRDFPNGASEAIQANRAAVADLITRIEGGPTPARPNLRVIRGGAA